MMTLNRIIMTPVILYVVVAIFHISVARFPTEPTIRRYVNEFHNKTSNVEMFTKYPHPHEPPPPIPGDDWNTSMTAPFPLSENECERKIDSIFNEFVRILCENERIKMTILTSNHQWFTQEALFCYNRLRRALTEHCVDVIEEPYAEKYSYVLMNSCNADWLNEEKIEDTTKTVCGNQTLKSF